MDLIERYLHAVRRNLPGRNADDIVAELRDALASRIEDREEAAGRPLAEEEIVAVIKDFGHPLVVAARFRRQQWLIGPDVFPFYLFTLRVVASIIAALLVAIGIAQIVFGGHDPLQALLQTIGRLTTSLLVNLAIVTIVFVVLERLGFPADHIKGWNPDQLAEVEDEQPGPWESAMEVALGLAFLLWWTGAFALPFPAGGAGFRIEPAPIFSELYWPILALAAVRLVHNLIQWLRPGWRMVRALIGGLTAVGGLVLIALIYRAGQWAVIVPAGMAADQAAQLETSLNLALKIALVVIFVVWTFQCLRALWVLSRARFRPAAA